MASQTSSPLQSDQRDDNHLHNRQKTVRLTVLSLSDIRVRVPPPESSLEKIVVGEGGAYYASKEKRPTSAASQTNDTSTSTTDDGPAGSIAKLPQHLQPLFDRVGLGLKGSFHAKSSRNQEQQQRQQNDRGNLSLSAAVSFSGSCPPQHMHVLSPSLCSKTGRMIVESDPVLRHGTDVADQSVHSMRHDDDGTISHVLVAKWDGADGIDGVGKNGSDPSENSQGDGSADSSSKSENWRRRREASFRRMGSSMSTQPHMTASLQHRPEDGLTSLYRSFPPSQSTSLPPDPSIPPRRDGDGGIGVGGKLHSLEEEELRESLGDMNIASADESDGAKAVSTSLPSLNETDESSSPKSSGKLARHEEANTDPFILRDVCTPPRPTERKGTKPPLPTVGATCKPAPPVAADLPDIFELNVDLLVGRDLASRVDGDSGGILQPLDPHAEKALNPVGGVAHLVLHADDLAADGSRTVDLPVRRRSPPPGAVRGTSAGATPVISNQKATKAEMVHPVVELGDDALLRVRIEVVSPKQDDADNDAVEATIQWTLSGASAAVAAGTEEADGEDVSMAKLADENQADATSTELIATDGAIGRGGGADEDIPATGMFCAGFTDIVGLWGRFGKKCVVNCVDHCDDDALVYVDDGDNSQSTIDTVYSKIMY